MRTRSYGKAILMSVLALAIVGWGCKHPAPTPPPPPPPAPAPPPATPTVTLQANPTNIEKGQSSTLTWSSTNATSLNLQPAVGSVAPEGSTSVTPDESTTYTITATGPGGNAEASARITVTVPPPPPPPAPKETIEDIFNREVKDAFFDFDKSDIRPDAREALNQTAQFLRNYPQVNVVIEGHCDERGSEEYNIALGDRRANAARQFLASLGISAERLKTVSYGKDRPFCTEHNEECWQQNRRAHFVLAK